MNRFEEYKIHYLRNINTGVKHINRHCYLRKFVFVGKLVDKVGRILLVIVNHSTEVRSQLRIQCIETLCNKYRMVMVIGKYYCFAYNGSFIETDAFLHKSVEYMVNCVSIEDIFENLGSADSSAVRVARV